MNVWSSPVLRVLFILGGIICGSAESAQAKWNQLAEKSFPNGVKYVVSQEEMTENDDACLELRLEEIIPQPGNSSQHNRLLWVGCEYYRAISRPKSAWSASVERNENVVYLVVGRAVTYHANFKIFKIDLSTPSIDQSSATITEEFIDRNAQITAALQNPQFQYAKDFGILKNCGLSVLVRDVAVKNEVISITARSSLESELPDGFGKCPDVLLQFDLRTGQWLDQAPGKEWNLKGIIRIRGSSKQHP